MELRGGHFLGLRGLLLALIFLSPAGVFASGMRLVTQDALAAARGEAFAATADNPSAIYYNPAGLTQLEGHQLLAGAYILNFDPTFTPPAGAPNSGTTYQIADRDAVAPQLYYSYGFGEIPLSVGLGVYAPHGAAVEWPENTGFRTVAISGELTYLRINPVIAYEVFPGFSLAGGIMVDRAELTLDQGLRRNAKPLKNLFRFDGEDLSAGYNLGLRWEICEQLSVGATFRSETTMDFTGDTYIEQQPIIQPTELPAAARYEFPRTAVFGISYRPTPLWDIGFDVDFTEWSSFDEVVIAQEGTPPFPVQKNIPVTLEWKDSWIYKFGVTRQLDCGWHVSAGYVYSGNSVPDDYYSPLVADMDRQFLSIGFGRRTERFTFDAAYQYGFASDHEVRGSLPSSTPGRFAGQNADGTYDFTSHALVLSMGLKF